MVADVPAAVETDGHDASPHRPPPSPAAETDVRKPRPTIIGSLIGIRGVLAWTVVLVHIAPAAIVLTPAVAPLWYFTWLHFYWALDMFFVLSGFVITYGYRDRFGARPAVGEYGRFLWARLARLYPVHMLVLTAMVAVVLVSRALGKEVVHGGDLGWDLVRNVLLTQGWGWSRTLTWNGPTWSLSAEWFCYLITPAVIAVIVRMRTPAAVIIAYVVATAVPLTVYSVIGFGDPQITYTAPLWRATGGFVGGALLCQLTHVGSRLPALLGRWTEGLVVVLLVLLAALAITGVPMLWALPVVGLVVLALAQQRGPLARALTGRRVQATGRLSLSLFLTHVPFFLGAALLVTPARFPGAWGWLGVGLMLIGAVVNAWVVRRLVEIPAGRWLGSLARRGRHRAEAAG